MLLEPNNTVIIILGASKWPKIPSLNKENRENLPTPFVNSAKGINDYFLDHKYLGVPRENILYLFDSKKNVLDLKDEINSFFDPNKFADKQPIHLFFYYVGHGEGDNGGYFLYLQSSSSSKKSRFKINNLGDIVKQISDKGIKIAGCYIIIDACFAGTASSLLKKQFGKLATPTDPADNRIRVETILLHSSSETRNSILRKENDSTLFTWALLGSLKERRKVAWSFDDLCSHIKEIIKNSQEEQIIPSVAEIYDTGSDPPPSQKKIFPPVPYPPQVTLELAVLKAVKEMTETGIEVTKSKIVERVNSQRGFQKEGIEKTINDLCQKQQLIKSGIFFSLGPAGNEHLAFNR